MLNNTIRFFLENKLVTWILVLVFVGWGIINAPFDLNVSWLPRNPVAVDAIPDIGENQQIVFTSWMGRSPQDVEDQISYPLTSALLGIPGVKTIRSSSLFGFSTIFIIFDDDIEFYWSRTRVLEKLNSLPADLLPDGVQPALGPDATALGQIYWYTLEGRDEQGNPTGGWDPHELRTIQDYYVRYALSASGGVAEVASIGGYVKEYQIDVDPDAMKINNITLDQVLKAVKESNIDIGAQTLEVNQVEYFVRGLGYIKTVEDVENSVVAVNNNIPLYIKDIARVNIGPATRRGALDKSGAEATGGVVISRYGGNPMQIIENVKAKIAEIEPGLPTRTLEDGTVSQVKIIPFYDRSQLIQETIGTLEEALSLEVLITVIVVILMLFNLKSSLLVSGTLPIAVLMCFVAMKQFGIDANIVSLSGIAIAIGTMVDMGIVLTESMVKGIKEAPPGQSLTTTIYDATVEVASAVITAVSTTIVSFLPVFSMQAAEGKLFKPLAFTKTFALVASIILAITVLPAMAHTLFSGKPGKSRWRYVSNLVLLAGGILIASLYNFNFGIVVLLVALLELSGVWIGDNTSEKTVVVFKWVKNIIYAGLVAFFLTRAWMPLGVNKSVLTNFVFVAGIITLLMTVFFSLIYYYEKVLRFVLRFRFIFLATVTGLVIWGVSILKDIGEEFMPSLDEGSFLLMPTSMPHAGIEQNTAYMRALDMAVTAIPEVESVVGKFGRAETALDPAPIAMFENLILYKPEYKVNEDGHRIRFKVDKNGEYLRDENGELIPDKKGKYYRQWRSHIKNPNDIWEEILQSTILPGVTSAPKLQPIETRLVMLQTGMRAPMGIKVSGPDLRTIEDFGLKLEKYLKEVDGVKAPAVFADRIVGKPYLEFNIDRKAIARYGLTIDEVQRYIQAGVGGMKMTTTVEGRERFPVRVRYLRELRHDPDVVKRILVTTKTGGQIPLGELVKVEYRAGPQSIKSEDSFLVGYVLFDRNPDQAEVTVVHKVQKYLEDKISSGELVVPAGVSYRFAGTYEQQVRASKRLSIVLPIALVIIFLILYFEFRSVAITSMVFTGVFIAFSGGFIMIWLYGQDWFMNFDLFGSNMRDLFQMRTINLSVAVWVGFIALFGIATDDGVLVATFLKDSFRKNHPTTVAGIHDAVVEGGQRRVRPAMMTTATTLLALLPVLTSTGRGADVMVPMAIPSFGGMALEVLTMFTVPVLYCTWKEGQLKWENWFGNNAEGVPSGK
jgi:copper/silver efflux system protein